MKIRKTVNEKGEIKGEILVNNTWISGTGMGYTLSRQLTGTTSENGIGIFNQAKTVGFSFGEYNMNFSFNNIHNWNDSAEKIAAILEDRIQSVTKWVAECKSKARVETAEIVTQEHAVEVLKEKESLYYRNRLGQITKLDI